MSGTRPAAATSFPSGLKSRSWNDPSERSRPISLPVVRSYTRMIPSTPAVATRRSSGEMATPVAPPPPAGPRRRTILREATFQTTVWGKLPVATSRRPSWLNTSESISSRGPCSSPTTEWSRKRHSVTRLAPGVVAKSELSGLTATDVDAFGTGVCRPLPATARGLNRNGRPSRRAPLTSHTIRLPSFDAE